MKMFHSFYSYSLDAVNNCVQVAKICNAFFYHAIFSTLLLTQLFRVARGGTRLLLASVQPITSTDGADKGGQLRPGRCADGGRGGGRVR